MHRKCVKDQMSLTNTHMQFASLAQSVERVAVNHKVIGSNPVGSDFIFYYFYITK